MSHFQDPLLLELVAAHSALGLPGQCRSVIADLSCTLRGEVSQLRRLGAGAQAAFAIMVRVAPILYYGLSGLFAFTN